MSLLVWNCRGLGNQVTESELGDYIRAKDPSVMFIAETWLDEARLKLVKRRLNFDHMFIVPRVNRGVGTCVVLEEVNEFAGGDFFKKSY